MTYVYLFNAALLAACLYALWAGGAPERATALVFIVAAALSYVVPYQRFHAVELPLLLVDICALAALTAIALIANRYWTLYVAAIQLLTVAIHAVKAYEPALAFWMYNGVSSRLAYPLLILLAVGVARHRERLVRQGRDRPWSISHRG